MLRLFLDLRFLLVMSLSLFLTPGVSLSLSLSLSLFLANSPYPRVYISILVYISSANINFFAPPCRSILDVCHNDIEFLPDFQQHHAMPDQLR